MQTPGLNTGHETFRDATMYTIARVKADDDTEVKALAVALKAAWDELNATNNAHRVMEDAMIAVMAMRDRVDGQVDDFVRAQFRAGQGAYGMRGQRIKALYPDSLTGLVKCPIREQPGKMRVQATRLAADSNETLAAGAELMNEKAGVLEDAVDAFELAVEQVAIAWAQVLRTRSEWIRIYDKTFGELVVLKGKKAANGFFKKLSKPRKKPTPTP
jgi:hypothetical protein